MIIPALIFADSITTLFDRVEQSDLYKSRSEAIDAEFEQKRASVYEDGWRVGGDFTYADLKDGSDSDTEYSVSIGKDFMLSGSKIEALLKEEKSYTKMLKEIEKNRIKARLWNLYGSYCITMKALQAKGELGVIYDEMNKYIDKGVRFGEFDASKSIMAYLALENLYLKISELDSKLQDYQSQIEAIVPFDGQFECHRLKPDFNKLFNPKYSALWPMLEGKVNSAKKMVTLSNNRTQTLSVDGSYVDEMDTRRYVLSLSIPLAFGYKNEAERASAMHTYASALHELKAFQKRYAQDTKALKTRLYIYKNHVSDTESSIKLSTDKLISQSKMRFKAGEESFISMLKSAEIKLQMIETIIELKTKRHESVANYLYNYAIDPQKVSIDNFYSK
jgi:hypothetical protein